VNLLRIVLLFTAALTAGYAFASLLLGMPTDAGAGAAMCAGCVVGVGCIDWRRHGRARMRAGREAVWQRRLDEDAQQ
jgi:hypothetical protein